MSNYKLNVNGAPHTVEVTDDTPLLWVLRDSLGLIGTKYGCGIGECGACTVLLDGVAAKSCRLLPKNVGSAKITTIEGLAAGGKLTAVQAAWCKLDVAQCGYCQGGQILCATALLAAKPKPTDQDIDAAMSGNFCRCASYTRIRQAIHAVAGGAS
jgi:isoquinoline 1-oxidoreductase alpha subunit